jgi:hypothetical protein
LRPCRSNSFPLLDRNRTLLFPILPETSSCWIFFKHCYYSLIIYFRNLLFLCFIGGRYTRCNWFSTFTLKLKINV